MDIKLARDVLRAVFRSAGELQAVLPALKEGCEDAEYQGYVKGIASVLAEMSMTVTNKVIAEHPQLEAEVEQSITTSGTY